ncbi:MAG: flagellar biosynthesis protein FlhA [Gammaproteobacteria bacterium]|nr:flagellar biosynthesis protein FlhA [Gammaproteobacteria bacterium]
MLTALLAMMVVPLPPMALDILFTFNIALALVVLLACVYAKLPLHFSSFPTVLLLATLMRLALNVASTRVILLEGHNGTDAAGEVINSFGNFVVGGNYVVGLVVFSILVLINFVVVTKGAGRISEVSARFTLDAMPGKQMAIDADLNAGVIDQEEAKNRRSEVVQEADFYGSMDGASKFVRGDAVAGIIILFINILGGLAIGMAQHDMTMADAVHNYTLLTIGDGLVAQIPSLVLSTASAIMVTRVSNAQDMGGQILDHLFNDPRVLYVTGGIIGLVGVVPGMPNLVFLGLAALCCGGAYYGSHGSKEASNKSGKTSASKTTSPVPTGGGSLPEETRDLSWDDVTPVDIVGLEVGYRLIPMVDKKQGGQLMSRIKGVRKKLTQELGFLMHSVHIKDNLNLPPNGYRIILKGVIAGEAEVYPEQDMAINPGQVSGVLNSVATTDPAFGLEAFWIDTTQRDIAQTQGYTVVDASTVIATHLSHILQAQSHRLLGREEAQHLLDTLAKKAPKLVEALVPDLLPLGVVLKVLKNLLEEQVSIRDIQTIVETLAEYAPSSQDPVVLTSAVRSSLGRSIIQNINGLSDDLSIITLDPQLEHILLESVQASGGDSVGLEPGIAERIQQSLIQAVEQQDIAGEPAVLVVAAALREPLAKFIRHGISSLHVLAFNELPEDMKIKVVVVIGNS